jgi:hypothetical protein
LQSERWFRSETFRSKAKESKIKKQYDGKETLRAVGFTSGFSQEK